MMKKTRSDQNCDILPPLLYHETSSKSKAIANQTGRQSQRNVNKCSVGAFVIFTICVVNVKARVYEGLFRSNGTSALILLLVLISLCKFVYCGYGM